MLQHELVCIPFYSGHSHFCFIFSKKRASENASERERKDAAASYSCLSGDSSNLNLLTNMTNMSISFSEEQHLTSISIKRFHFRETLRMDILF